MNVIRESTYLEMNFNLIFFIWFITNGIIPNGVYLLCYPQLCKYMVSCKSLHLHV